MLRSPLRSLIDFVWPSQCIACHTHSDAPPLCPNCVADLDRISAEPACDRCGYPIVTAGDPCPHCHDRGLSPLDRIARLAVFHDPIRGMVHRMKYGKAWPLAEYFADRLADHEPAKGLLSETDRFVPIPLHPTRQFERGYNQAEVMARRLGWRCDIHVVEALTRTRATETQADLRAQQARQQNVRNAFGLIDGTDLRDRHITLVDDVLTTGSTLRSAARALAAAKPASISAIVIAVADPKGRHFEVI